MRHASSGVDGGQPSDSTSEVPTETGRPDPIAFQKATLSSYRSKALRYSAPRRSLSLSISIRLFSISVGLKPDLRVESLVAATFRSPRASLTSRALHIRDARGELPPEADPPMAGKLAPPEIPPPPLASRLPLLVSLPVPGSRFLVPSPPPSSLPPPWRGG
jgi:hypothetical protein